MSRRRLRVEIQGAVQGVGFRPFLVRGRAKVKTEWGLVSIAHNLKKVAAA